MKKKFLSLILAAFMVFTLIPALGTGVSAKGDNVLSSAGGTLNGVYVLIDDVVLDNNIVVESTATVSINLNGHVLQGTGSGTVIKNYGNLVIYDTEKAVHCFSVESTGIWTYIGNSSAVVNYTFDSTDGLKTPDGTVASTAIPAEGDIIAVNGGCITGGFNTFSYGGGIYNEGNLTINDACVIGNGIQFISQDGYSAYGGGIYNYKGNITLNAAAVCGNAVFGDSGTEADFFGGGIYNYGTLTMNGGFVSFNSVTGDGDDCLGYGGGICSYVEFTMHGGTISGNTADANGGGASVFGKTEITDGSICCNKAYNGAGMAASGDVVISGAVLFYGNTAEYSGGAIYLIGTATVSGAVFENNTAKWGGAIEDEGNLTLTGCTFSANSSSQSGGAVYNYKRNIIIKDCSFNNNTGSWGAGFYSDNGYSDVSGCTFTGNYAAGGNGGAICNGGEITLTDCTLNGNEALYGGGAIYTNSTATIVNSTMSDNEAQTYGGAVYNYGVLDITGGTFSVNSSSNSGGAVENCGTATITNVEFANNTSLWGGAICNDGSMTVTSSAFTGNNSINGGGAICNDQPATITDCVFTGNTAGWGAAISGYGSMTLTECTFAVNSSANGAGGAIYTQKEITATGCTFSNNACYYAGGALYLWAPATLTDCIINNNESTGRAGGAIYTEYPITLTGCTITGNKANYGGGAMYTYSSATIVNCIISDNEARGSGGAIYTDGILDVSGSTFERNKSEYGAGAIFTSNDLTISDSVISENYASGYAGGVEVWSDAANVVIDSTAIIGNESTSFGGGVYSWTNSLTITNSTISNNSAGWSGGGIITCGIFTMTSSAIEDNYTEGYGGGIYYSSSSAIITGCTIDGNESANSGGGVYIYYGDVTIKDSSISDNFANGWGGGIYNYADSLTITGCTVNGNEVLNGGGGIYNSTYSVIEDTVVSTNSSGYDGGIANFGTMIFSGKNEIKANSSGWCGGIYSASDSTLISDGALYITDNKSACHAGIATFGTAVFNGETYITGNTDTSDDGYPGAGYYTYLYDSTANTFNGKLVIENNTVKTGSTTSSSNLCLDGQSSAVLVTLSSGFCIEDGKPIGVTIIVSGAIDSGAITTLCDKDYSSCFKSDVPEYIVYNLANTVMLGGEHEHDWSYTLSSAISANDTIIAECNGTGEPCDVPASDRQITITAPDNLVYDGQDKTAALSKSGTFAGESVPEIVYEYKATSSGVYSSALNLKDAGFYKASITVGSGATAYVEYEVTRKQITVTAENATITEGDAVPAFKATVEGIIGSDAISYSFVDVKADKAGVYGITLSGATVQGNYEIVYVPATLTVNPTESSATKVGSQGLNEILKKYQDENPGAEVKVEFNISSDAVDSSAVEAIKSSAGTKELEVYSTELVVTVDSAAIEDAADNNTTLLSVTYKFDFNDRDEIQIFRADGTTVDELTTTPNSAGEYVIIDKAAGTITVVASKSKTIAFAYSLPEPPATGDSMWIYIAATVALIGTGITVIARKRKENN